MAINPWFRKWTHSSTRDGMEFNFLKSNDVIIVLLKFEVYQVNWGFYNKTQDDYDDTLCKWKSYQR